MSVAWDIYHPFVAIHAPHAPYKLLTDMVRFAAIEFCKITNVWHVLTTGSAITTGANPRTFAVTVPQYTKPWMLRWAQWHIASAATDVVPLTCVTHEELDTLVARWRSGHDDKGTPQYITMRTEGYLVMAPWPDANGTLDYDVSYIPAIDSVAGHDDLYHHFGETIAQGAAARLLAIDKQPWTNLVKAKDLDRDFHRNAADAMVHIERGRSQSIIRTATDYRGI